MPNTDLIEFLLVKGSLVKMDKYTTRTNYESKREKVKKLNIYKTKIK